MHFAAESVIADHAYNERTRLERLRELLYSLAASIPEAWATTTRALLSRREKNIERLIEGVSFDLSHDKEHEHYLILSSIFQLVLTVKQVMVQGHFC